MSDIISDLIFLIDLPLNFIFIEVDKNWLIGALDLHGADGGCKKTWFERMLCVVHF